MTRRLVWIHLGSMGFSQGLWGGKTRRDQMGRAGRGARRGGRHGRGGRLSLDGASRRRGGTHPGASSGPEPSRPCTDAPAGRALGGRPAMTELVCSAARRPLRRAMPDGQGFAPPQVEDRLHELAAALGAIEEKIRIYKDMEEPSASDSRGDTVLAGLAKLAEIGGHAGEEVVAPLADLGRYVVEFAYGDSYCRSGLSPRERELATVGMLTAMGGREPQLRCHLGAALKVGLRAEELEEVIIQTVPYAGFPTAINALHLLKQGSLRPRGPGTGYPTDAATPARAPGAIGPGSDARGQPGLPLFAAPS